MNAFQWGWVGFAAYFVVLEGLALWRSWRARKKGKPDRFTLSSQLWVIFGTARGTKATAWAWVRRGVLVLALLWLPLHIGSGGQII